MSEKAEKVPQPEGAPDEDQSADTSDLHWLQRLLDNPWLLLALGLIVPTLSYTAWAWIELLLIKPAELP